MGWNLLYSDDFDRDDGPLGDDWNVLNGAVAIVSNEAEASTYYGLAQYLPAGDLADCVLEVDNEADLITYAGVAFRIQDGSNYYTAIHHGVSNRYRIYKVVAGDLTVIASHDAGGDPSINKLGLSCDGDTFVFYRDDAELFSVEDSTYSDGGVGIYMLASSARLDNFAIYTVSTMTGMVIT